MISQFMNIYLISMFDYNSYINTIAFTMASAIVSVTLPTIILITEFTVVMTYLKMILIYHTYLEKNTLLNNFLRSSKGITKSQYLQISAET